MPERDPGERHAANSKQNFARSEPSTQIRVGFSNLSRKARLIYGLCSLVLAGYREFLAATGDAAAAFEAVRAAFRRTHAVPAKLITRVLLRLVRDPAKALSRMSLAKHGRARYGSAMAFEQEAIEDGIDLIVSRCVYHGFFAEHGEPQLTRVFCEWDRNWMDAIDASDRPICVERPTTISTGGECCRFRFVHEVGHDAESARDIILAPPAERPGGIA